MGLADDKGTAEIRALQNAGGPATFRPGQKPNVTFSIPVKLVVPSPPFMFKTDDGRSYHVGEMSKEQIDNIVGQWKRFLFDAVKVYREHQKEKSENPSKPTSTPRGA